MAYASDNRTTTIALGDRFAALVETLKTARAKRKIVNQTYFELNQLSNAELADIGLNRSMIKSVAQSAAENI